MLFNSFQFLIFFPLVAVIYFVIPYRFRVLFLLLSSYYFYMNWQPVYAVLIFFSSTITWLCGLVIQKEKLKGKRKAYLVISLIINFGILFFFKYFNFVNDTIFNLLESANLRWQVPNFDVLLPVGISFYTFQAVGYTIDVYRGDLKAEQNFFVYALFVSFFPQLVAGPIERAKNLLPQLHQRKYFSIENFKHGLSLIIWGLFMKVVVSDRIGLYVDATYNNVGDHNGVSLALATVLFSFQIYCDFAGYSSIAIGTARIIGFELMTNFKRPYFSKSIAEFWHRWHISLSTWFRDYLYIPLGGNRVSKPRTYLNLFVTFVVSGIWHGANWTFVIWGALHGLFNTIQKYTRFGNRRKQLHVISMLAMISVNYVLVTFAWIFFRANSLRDAELIIGKIFSFEGSLYLGDISTILYGGLGLMLLVLKETREEYFPQRLKFMSSQNAWSYSFSHALIILIILSIGVFNGGQFIYFQF